MLKAVEVEKQKSKEVLSTYGWKSTICCRAQHHKMNQLVHMFQDQPEESHQVEVNNVRNAVKKSGKISTTRGTLKSLHRRLHQELKMNP